jgi:dUTP pyrophosphatase
MANFMDLADGLSMEEQARPLLNMIEQIMTLPEESLNEDSIEIISGMIKGALTPRIREESIKDVLRDFENGNLTRSEAANFVAQNKAIIQQAIDELEPSPNKRTLLDATFDFFYDVFDEAFARYHSYAFELPVKLEDGGQIPTYAHETDACADVYASKDTVIPAHSISNKVPTGLRIALPEGWVAKIAPRSSIGMKTGLRLSNSIGIIDADYRGEIGVIYDNISDSDYTIKAGDRIAQIWVERVERFKPVPVDILPATERGEGGFGSTGK